MKKKLTHIGDILDAALKDFRPAEDTEMTKIWAIWPDALGDVISKETKPAAFRNHTLIVHVSSSTWLQHLTFSKHEIISNLNIALQRDLVKEIKFKIAAIHH